MSKLAINIAGLLVIAVICKLAINIVGLLVIDYSYCNRFYVYPTGIRCCFCQWDGLRIYCVWPCITYHTKTCKKTMQKTQQLHKFTTV